MAREFTDEDIELLQREFKEHGFIWAEDFGIELKLYENKDNGNVYDMVDLLVERGLCVYPSRLVTLGDFPYSIVEMLKDEMLEQVLLERDKETFFDTQYMREVAYPELDLMYRQWLQKHFIDRKLVTIDYTKGMPSGKVICEETSEEVWVLDN